MENRSFADDRVILRNKRSSTNSNDLELEHFPVDLLSSTKHEEFDNGISEERRGTIERKYFQNMADRMMSTGSIDMVGYVPSPQELSPDKENDNLKDVGNHITMSNLEIANNFDNRRCLTCKLCCKGFWYSVRKWFIKCTKPCMTEHNPLSSPKPTLCERFKYGLMCPPHGSLGRWLTLLMTVAFIWGVLWSITGKEALPGGNFFALLILIVFCYIGGMMVEKCRLPPLLGMLVVGIILRNVPKINVGKDIDPNWSSALRNIALVVILTRAGLGLDPKALKKLSCGVLRLALIPCLVEAVVSGVVAHFILSFPWIWGFMMGFVLAAVSPAVVVPSMLTLQEKGLGVDKGIPTLVIAAASLDDVLAISGFGICLGIAFSEGNLVLTICKGPLEALGGILYGISFGIMCWYLPNKKHSQKTVLRFFLLFFGGLLATFGSRSLGIAGAGALGCLTMAFVAGLGWRKELKHSQQLAMSQIMAAMWIVLQPLLFGLIGVEIDILSIQLKTIGLGIAVLFSGLMMRCIAAFFTVFGTSLNWREKMFIPLAWLPKATVQAAIGSVALDTARSQTEVSPYFVELGTQLLTVAVLVIIITAPVGAIAISLSAPRLLNKSPRTIKTVDIESTKL